MAYAKRPCVKESPNIGCRSYDRFVGCYEYHPSDILRAVAKRHDISLLAFPFKAGVYVNRGRLIGRDGTEKRV